MFALKSPRRTQLQTYLSQRGIETLIHYPVPVHQQPCLSHLFSRDMHFVMAEKWAAEELSLPISPVMTDEEAELVVKTLNQF